jgi:hypothetical protein
MYILDFIAQENKDLFKRGVQVFLETEEMMFTLSTSDTLVFLTTINQIMTLST